jgi:hypothetical protein
LEGRTRSNSNGRAWLSLFCGLVATALVPAAIAVSQQLAVVKLVRAWPAIPLAVMAGILALLFARGARHRLHWTLGRGRGRRVARLGRALGWLGIYLAATAALSLAVYGLLAYYSK